MSDTNLKKNSGEMKLISESPDDTFNLGLVFGQTADTRGVIALIGPLGAGKTRFVQGLAKGLGIDAGTVNSPTYGLVHFHKEGRLSLCHVDLYRLSHPDEIESLGIEEDLESEGIAAIEWADKGLAILPEGRITLEINDRDEDQREILLQGSDRHHCDWIDRVVDASPLVLLPANEIGEAKVN